MCAALFIDFYGSPGSVGTFVECAALRPDLQHDQLRSEGGSGLDTFYLPTLSKGFLMRGRWCAFQFAKATMASLRTTWVYQTLMASD